MEADRTNQREARQERQYQFEPNAHAALKRQLPGGATPPACAGLRTLWHNTVTRGPAAGVAAGAAATTHKNSAINYFRKGKKMEKK
ncbi:MAG: hypothetical protein ACOVO0_02215, partial [Burkholderiaceae bacterium]